MITIDYFVLLYILPVLTIYTERMCICQNALIITFQTYIYTHFIMKLLGFSWNLNGKSSTLCATTLSVWLLVRVSYTWLLHFIIISLSKVLWLHTSHFHVRPSAFRKHKTLTMKCNVYYTHQIISWIVFKISDLCL